MNIAHRDDHAEQKLYPSSPSAAYVRQWFGSAMVKITACCVLGAKPLSKPKLSYCQLHT